MVLLKAEMSAVADQPVVLFGLTSADCQSPGHSVTDSCAWRKDKPQINTLSKNTGRNLRQRSCNVYRRRYAHATQAFFFG